MLAKESFIGTFTIQIAIFDTIFDNMYIIWNSLLALVPLNWPNFMRL